MQSLQFSFWTIKLYWSGIFWVNFLSSGTGKNMFLILPCWCRFLPLQGVSAEKNGNRKILFCLMAFLLRKKRNWERFFPSEFPGSQPWLTQRNKVGVGSGDHPGCELHLIESRGKVDLHFPTLSQSF